MIEQVEIFKTNVQDKAVAKRLVKLLLKHLPGTAINFDLDDCDKILRVQHNGLNLIVVQPLLNKHGFNCEILH